MPESAYIFSSCNLLHRIEEEVSELCDDWGPITLPRHAYKRGEQSMGQIIDLAVLLSCSVVYRGPEPR